MYWRLSEIYSPTDKGSSPKKAAATSQGYMLFIVGHFLSQCAVWKLKRENIFRKLNGRWTQHTSACRRRFSRLVPDLHVTAGRWGISRLFSPCCTTKREISRTECNSEINTSDVRILLQNNCNFTLILLMQNAFQRQPHSWAIPVTVARLERGRYYVTRRRANTKTSRVWRNTDSWLNV